MFARAGSITPTGPRVLNSRQVSTEPVTLNVFPGSDGAYRLYADDGTSIAYTRGGTLDCWMCHVQVSVFARQVCVLNMCLFAACTWTDISMTTQGGVMTIKIAPSSTGNSFMIARFV